MEKFIMKNSKEADIYKSIQVPVEVNDAINRIVKNANKNKSNREYSFNGFVFSA